jgi:ribosomal protein S18 acetylase RimI-like enzyme
MFILTDKSILEHSFRKNPSLNIYQLGDLDDFFWKYTTWYGDDAENPQNIILVYAGVTPPTMIALTEDVPGMTILLKNVKQSLPEKFFCHLTPGLIGILDKENIIEDYGLHYKMTLKNLNPDIKIDEDKIRQLAINDIETIKHFYSFSYIGNWFDARMLETGMYYGYFENDELIGIAGIHIYSPEYKVAAIGNVTTHPAHRGKGIATQVTYKLCCELVKKVEHIGLNVMPDNEAAIRSYKKIGFEVTAEYEEYFLGNK